MISRLRIRNLATIEDLAVDFRPGFSILTGETGAGKSIVIDGLRLVLGEKGSPEFIRTGEKEASVEAVFALPAGLPQNCDLPLAEEKEIFIQRQLSEQGSGRAYINGILVPVRKLREFGGGLVDIYGQNDHVFLLHLENHLHFLDAFCASVPLRDEVGRAAQELKSLIKQKRELEARERERVQRLDFLSYQIDEIERARLKQGEEESLAAARNILKNAERISALVEKAMDLTSGEDDSLLPGLARLQNVLHELGAYDQSFQSTGETLGELAIVVRELSDFLVKFRERQMSAPDKLEVLEDRLNLIEKLKRKYGAGIDEILLHLGKIKGEHQDLVANQERMADLEMAIARKFSDYRNKAGELSALRVAGARELERSIEKEIGLLGMKKARFKIRVGTIPLSEEDSESVKENGTEEVEFLISPNPGEELRPLRRIASGGELSRVMLALKTVGKEVERFKTLIFDEIDAGIGGRTAECIAQKLKKLAERHQVLCITHLPQIASFAAHHYRIDKKIEKDRTYTTVRMLKFEERVGEVARLISGSRITQISLQNAREMLGHNLKREEEE